MAKINLLYVITKLELGGAQKHLLDLIRGLDRERFNVFFFSARQGILTEDAFSLVGANFKRSRYLDRQPDLFKDLLALAEIYFFIRRNKIAVVHTHSSKGGILGRIAAKLAGAKVIIHTVHGWSFNDYQPRLVRWFNVRLERLCAGFSDKLIVVSRSDLEKGLKRGVGSRSQYEVIRYGIDFPEFASAGPGLRKELGIGREVQVVAMVACFKPQKDPLGFIRMASLISKSRPGTRFILAGDGLLRDKVEALIKRLKLEKQVILLGWRRDIPRILAATDVFVLASFWEGLPISVLEALAASKPVVATDTGGIGEVVQDGQNGFLVQPGAIPRMAEKLELLLRDNGLRQRLGHNAGQSLGREFTRSTMVENISHLYSSLIRDHFPNKIENCSGQ